MLETHSFNTIWILWHEWFYNENVTLWYIQNEINMYFAIKFNFWLNLPFSIFSACGGLHTDTSRPDLTAYWIKASWESVKCLMFMAPTLDCLNVLQALLPGLEQVVPIYSLSIAVWRLPGTDLTNDYVVMWKQWWHKIQARPSNKNQKGHMEHLQNFCKKADCS